MSNRNLTIDESDGYNLSRDERYLITNYITQYNQTNNQINHLYTVLEELRHNIATIYNNSRQLDNMHNTINTMNAGSNNTNNTNTSGNTRNPRNSRNNINMSINRDTGRSSYNLTDYINNLYREINMIIPMTPIESISVIPLSQEEIAEFTLTQPFSSFESPINNECPIRLEDFSQNDMVTQIKKCGHIFNSAELTNWFQNNIKCPVCRGDVKTRTPRRERVTRREPNLYNFDHLFDFVFRNIDTSNNIIPSNNNISSNNNSASNNNSNNSIDESTARY